jgi:hypothetical protein
LILKNKGIYILIGSVAIIGIGYYLWNKNKQTSNLKSNEIADDVVVDKETKVAIETKEELTPKLIKISKEELESKLQGACGKKPKLKKNKILYDKCRSKYIDKLKSQGYTSFDGGFEGVVSEEFFNQFDNGWDINL